MLKKNSKYDYLKIFTYFLFFAFLGWVFETTVVFINFNKLTARGYMFFPSQLSPYLPFLKSIENTKILIGLPFIEMYGIGSVIAILIFKKYRDRPLILFLGGMIVMTLFEYLGSYFCTFFLGKSYWSYAHEPFNFQGRICLSSAIAWGALTVIFIKYVEPICEKLYEKNKDSNFFKILVYTLIILCCLIAYFKYIILG